MAVLLDTWRKVYTQVRAQVAGPLVLAGKSMGGRIASMLADELQVQALVCLGYPFYPAGKTDRPRIEHLTDLRTPTLIVQGERDALGAKVIVQPYPLSTAIEFAWLAFADNDLKPLKRNVLLIFCVKRWLDHQSLCQEAVVLVARGLADLLRHLQ